MANKYKHIQMGVIGEPIIGSTHRLQAMKREHLKNHSDLKINSIELSLPRIIDSNVIIKPDISGAGRDLKLPKLNYGMLTVLKFEYISKT